jgi:hypothetical protein
MEHTSSARRLLTQAQYARHRGVTRAMVSKYGKSDRLVIVDGKVDVVASDALLAGSLDPARGGRGGKSDRQQVGRGAPSPAQAQQAPAQRSAPGPDTYSRVRTHREAFAAKTAEAEYRKMIGELVERDEYNRALTLNIGPTIQRLHAISARLGARVAAEIDVRKCVDMIDTEVESIIGEIADYAQALIDRSGKTRQ